MALNSAITINNLGKVLALIGSIIAAWLFLTSNFVGVAEFRAHNFTVQASFIEMQIDIIEDRIDRALKGGDDMKAKKLNHRRARLEHKQEFIIEQQLQ